MLAWILGLKIPAKSSKKQVSYHVSYEIRRLSQSRDLLSLVERQSSEQTVQTRATKLEARC